MSAMPAREDSGQRAGSVAAAEWARLQVTAPQVVLTIHRYLRQLGVFLAPRSVTAAEGALRQFARWLVTEAQITVVANIRRDDIEDYKVWLAARPRAGGQVIAAETHRQRIRTVRAFSGSDHRMGLARRPAPQPGHRRGHPEKARAAAQVPRATATRPG